MIKIQTTPAVLGLSIQKVKMDIQQPKAELDIKSTHPQVRIEATLPTITIDQYQAFAEAGLKNIADLTRDTVAYARSEQLKSIGKRAQQGRALKNIQSGQNAIASNAKYNATQQFNREFGLGFIPKTRPKIDVIEGELDIRVEEGTITNNTRAQKPIINNTPGKVNFALEQYNSIKMEYVEDEKLSLQI